MPHSALELCLQLEIAHGALAVDPREVSVVVKVMAIIMMAGPGLTHRDAEWLIGEGIAQ